MFNCLEDFVGCYVAELVHLLDDARFLAQPIDPLGVRYLLVNAPVHFWQARWRDVPVKTLHVLTVKEYATGHVLVQQGLEHREYYVEDPGLIDYMNSLSFHRKRRHHQCDNHAGNLKNKSRLLQASFHLFCFLVEESFVIMRKENPFEIFIER